MARHDEDILERSADSAPSRLRQILPQRSGTLLLIGLMFWALAAVLIIAGRNNSGHHLGDFVSQPVHARVNFAYFDNTIFETARARAQELEPRVYRPNSQAFSWSQLEEQLRQLPEVVTGMPAQLPPAVRGSFDASAISLLGQYAGPDRKGTYQTQINLFIAQMRKLVIIPAEQRNEEITRQTQWRSPMGFAIRVGDSDGNNSALLPIDRAYGMPMGPGLASEIRRAAADCFREDLAPQIAEYVGKCLGPTHVLDPRLTAEAQERAGKLVPMREGEIQNKAGSVIKASGEITDRDLGMLQAEHKAYRASLPWTDVVRDYIGIAGLVSILAVVLSWYIQRYQPRVMRNHTRAMAIALLLLAMMALSQLAGPGTRPLYLFGVAPTILTAIVLAIAYEPRFALGVSMILSVLITLALGQDMPFLLVLLSGCCGTCAFTGTVRTRGRLIEIGLASAAFMAVTMMFTGVFAQQGVQPFSYVRDHAIHVAIAGLGAGFVVLGVLPFVEKAFRITTGMTLVELSDASNPLQRRLAAEAPGTYSHSLQVATLSEAAAEAIGANSMLARVGALYHDIGKTKRPGYFCENQGGNGSAHMALSPEVSARTIIDHVKDGVELAKQNNLPTALFPFIQQHHGAMLVEYFYHEACKAYKATGSRGEAVNEASFRYPGPKPRTRETAIVMLADCCESAARAIDDPTAEAIENLVHTLTTKRLIDGQLSECDLTIHELATVERTLIKSLQSMHHSRIAYPSTAHAPAAATGT